MTLEKGVITSLLQGVRSFREREYAAGASLMPSLADGQRPGAMVIACADSRVDPALIFGASPGDLLVVRQVANLVPPPSTDSLDSGLVAAVELGLKKLRIPHLIVCGHSNCAGVRTVLDKTLQNSLPDSPPAKVAASGNIESEFACLQDWAAIAEPACREVLAAHVGRPVEELARHAEQCAILQSLENLRARPWLRELESSGELTLHGWWFEIATGKLWAANPDTGEFSAI